MPVIVIGADTPMGGAVLNELLPRDSEVRAFVTAPETVAGLRARGVKVACGDISDASHVGGAALNCFCAVLIQEAAVDDRERSFADDPPAVLEAWIEGLNDAGVTRTILVWHDPPAASVEAIESETVVVDPERGPADCAVEVARLEDLAELS